MGFCICGCVCLVYQIVAATLVANFHYKLEHYFVLVIGHHITFAKNSEQTRSSTKPWIKAYDRCFACLERKKNTVLKNKIKITYFSQTQCCPMAAKLILVLRNGLTLWSFDFGPWRQDFVPRSSYYFH